ncbi:MAG: hypothetical protein C0504_18315 [Candidatus Solibacter sp.]|nr:hypothetical protein [Candidatus Solibacter sp.]
MWRFTRNNSMTEGFHPKMELFNRQASGLRNFNNYGMRVNCSQGRGVPRFWRRAGPLRLIGWR